MPSIKNLLTKNVSNIPGWRTKSKLVVIESDDWGSIRMPSADTFRKLSAEGIDLISDEGFRFNKFDTLASSEDLSALFEVLSGTRDSTGREIVLTPISVVANPDFEKIADSQFQDYAYEPFTVTLKRYPGCEDSFSDWKEGIEKRLFVPQFHGREHLNVSAWMKSLQEGNKQIHLAFNHRMWGISTANDPEIKLELQAAFDFIDPRDLEYQEVVIRSGLDLFKELFGYKASCFIPPNGPFSNKLIPACSDSGIRCLSAAKIQLEPLGNGNTTKKIHWLGQKDPYGIRYITRNCFFEPSQDDRDWIDSCMNDIATAFRWHKPAVISSHRVNFIGRLHKKNRDHGLKQLGTLLKEIMKNWPETEFITSAELGERIFNE